MLSRFGFSEYYENYRDSCPATMLDNTGIALADAIIGSAFVCRKESVSVFLNRLNNTFNKDRLQFCYDEIYDSTDVLADDIEWNIDINIEHGRVSYIKLGKGIINIIKNYKLTAAQYLIYDTFIMSLQQAIEEQKAYTCINPVNSYTEDINKLEDIRIIDNYAESLVLDIAKTKIECKHLKNQFTSYKGHEELSNTYKQFDLYYKVFGKEALSKKSKFWTKDDRENLRIFNLFKKRVAYFIYANDYDRPDRFRYNLGNIP